MVFVQDFNLFRSQSFDVVDAATYYISTFKQKLSLKSTNANSSGRKINLQFCYNFILDIDLIDLYDNIEKTFIFTLPVELMVNLDFSFKDNLNFRLIFRFLTFKERLVLESVCSYFVFHKSDFWQDVYFLRIRNGTLTLNTQNYRFLTVLSEVK